MCRMDDKRFTTLKTISLWRERNPHLTIKEACNQIFNHARKKHKKIGFPLSTPQRFYNYVIQYSKRINYNLSTE